MDPGRFHPGTGGVEVAPGTTAVTWTVGTSVPLFIEFEGMCFQVPPWYRKSEEDLVMTV